MNSKLPTIVELRRAVLESRYKDRCSVFQQALVQTAAGAWRGSHPVYLEGARWLCRLYFEANSENRLPSSAEIDEVYRVQQTKMNGDAGWYTSLEDYLDMEATVLRDLAQTDYETVDTAAAIGLIDKKTEAQIKAKIQQSQTS